MSSRLGVVTQMGLGENIREKVTSPFLKWISIYTIIFAIVCGNSAFEVGNIIGCSIGLSMIGEFDKDITIVLISASCLLLILSNNYERIESFLIMVVGLMAIIFLLLAFISAPDYKLILKGLLCPTLGHNDLLTIMGIVGTTIGPYSLFLHASAATRKWHSKEEYSQSRIDTIVSISIGGLISMCIIIMASSFLHNHNIAISNTQDFIIALNSIGGNNFTIFIGVALFLAGFSSVITAALGAAIVFNGVLQTTERVKKQLFKFVCIFIICVGTIIAIFLENHTIELILSAQILNAIILPLVIFFVIYCVNTKDMGEHKNTILCNILSGIILVTIFYISIYTLFM